MDSYTASTILGVAGDLNKGIFNPSSNEYGAVTMIASTISILASIGTIWALMVTIKSVNESRNQFELISKRDSLDNLQKALDDILDRIVFMKEHASGAEVYFGKPAIYRATYNQSTLIFDSGRNVDHFKDYINQLDFNIGESLRIISTINHPNTAAEYKKKLTADLGFSILYVIPLLKILETKYTSHTIIAQGLISKLRAVLTRSLEAQLIQELPAE